MKKTLILLLCILTLSVIFTSCGKAKDTAADTTANTTEDAAQSGISIIKPDGTTDYVLVYLLNVPGSQGSYLQYVFGKYVP